MNMTEREIGQAIAEAYLSGAKECQDSLEMKGFNRSFSAMANDYALKKIVSLKRPTHD